MKASPWFFVPKQLIKPRLRIFCFPYAGGSATAFHPWGNIMPADVEVCAIQLPGRGMRFKEPNITSMPDLIEQLDDVMTPHLDGCPYVMFGHSMGTGILFEYMQLIRNKAVRQPVHLFFSGRRAPQIPDGDETFHTMSDEKLLDELKRYDGTPVEVMEHPELMQLFLPVIRSDFQLLETWMPTQADPFDIPMTVYGGEDDHRASRQMLEAWKEQTVSDFSLKMFPGGHFYLSTHQELFMRDFVSRLEVIG